MSWTDTPRKRWTWVAPLTVTPVDCPVDAIPPADYLPEGKKNFIMGFMVTAPGMGMTTASDELVEVIDGRLAPYLSGEKQPQLSNYFLGTSKGWGTFMGGETIHDEV